ncbi:MAG: GntR family transcriptional regulator [Victivallaceae bacterium]
MKQNIPKYIEIKEKIISSITSGKLAYGDKLPTREALVKEYEVTRATLNKAFKELIREGWLNAGTNTGTFVSQPKSSQRIALVSKYIVRDTSGWPHAFLWSEEFKYFAAYDSDSKIEFLEESAVLKKLEMLSDYDRVIWIFPPDEMFGLLLQLRHKIIAVNRYGDFNFVSTNHREAVKDITQKCIMRFDGKCQLIYLDRPEKLDSHFICSERREGFLQGCKAFNKYYRICQMTENFHNNVDLLMKLELNSYEPAVIISSTRFVTGAVLRMANLRGLKIGEDIFYSDFDFANGLELTGTKFLSVVQDYEKIAKVAIQSLESIDKNQVQCFIPYHIIHEEILRPLPHKDGRFIKK